MHQVVEVGVVVTEDTLVVGLVGVEVEVQWYREMVVLVDKDQVKVWGLGFRVSQRRCLWVSLSGGLLIEFYGPPHPLTHKHHTVSVLPAPTTQT